MDDEKTESEEQKSPVAARLGTVHRDDLPMDLAEEVVSTLQKLYPGFKVSFAGDNPGEPGSEMAKAIADMQKALDHAFYEGLCFRCKKKIPIEWPPATDEFEMPEGWGMLYQGEEPMELECPDCAEDWPEEDEGPQVRRIDIS